MKYKRFIHSNDNLNGILYSLYCKLGPSSYFDTVKATSSTAYGLDGYRAKSAIDFQRSSFWTAADTDKNSTLEVELPFAVLLDGYSIQTSNSTYFAKSWYISASNDGNFWSEEFYDEDTGKLMENGGFESAYVSRIFDNPYRIFRIRFGSSYCESAPRFDISQIEFFGTVFSSNVCSKRNLLVNIKALFMVTLMI